MAALDLIEPRELARFFNLGSERRGRRVVPYFLGKIVDVELVLRESTTARSMQFESSLTLPGQGYSTRSRSASAESPVSGRRARSAKCERKWRARSNTSVPARTCSAGSAIWITLMR